MNTHPTSGTTEAYIALGANLGDREATLMEALARLDAHSKIEVLRCSRLYETDPVGYLDQPCFLNMTAALRTALGPEELLVVMQQIELELGRERKIRYGPRTVDLDLLWVEGQEIDTPLLTLPHPRMMERAFVLVPLADIVAEEESSGLYRRTQEALTSMDGKEGVRFWKICNWRSESGLTEN
ncbi:2-amino-4-hydroxy-6-hydroxymethyldihydropteridine diphosphokinase [Paenibacillus sp. FSL W8-0186]|uniref:2-amino-4-hydroxy-6-hydroxymethyldihydropteridine diphosphokinase n=1 Tax=Paenibacillus woosongensis TaxID=307580 RepID=A0ABQ4MZK6_9BACL|nr:2-amino-4-hydroxy-6-hydroxymethyldihydropteridine diphosphokinase [Paenibacillus woosongensis]GIP61306.1 2-amino-4-hydroxy-6-hydroxymethyldihydropteridine pyrophosphokinase [Paenibacillus woosongensis]